jgi:hypothetical protein
MGAVVASEKQNSQQSNKIKIMKRTVISSLIAVSLLLGGVAMTTFAGNGPGNGRGHGGPPQTDEERAARQAACLERNGGVCPNGGPRAECPGYGQRGQGKGKKQGQGWRRGARNGTGPRAGTGNCPVDGQGQTQK